MKTELGYYIDTTPIGQVEIPIYGLRAVPQSILNRLPKGYDRQMWQVQIHLFNKYVWINQSRRLIFFR